MDSRKSVDDDHTFLWFFNLVKSTLLSQHLLLSADFLTRYTPQMAELKKLNELLSAVKAAEHYSIYRAFKQAIKTGELAAVPTVGTVELQRQKGGPLSVPEFLISGEADQWLAQVQERRQKPKSRALKHLVTLEDVQAGRVNFEEAAERYRASLQPKPKRRRRSKDQGEKSTETAAN